MPYVRRGRRTVRLCSETVSLDPCTTAADGLFWPEKNREDGHAASRISLARTRNRSRVLSPPIDAMPIVRLLGRRHLK